MIRPENALKLSNQVFKERVIERRTDENEYTENELVDRFLQLIQQDKNQTDRKKMRITAAFRDLKRIQNRLRIRKLALLKGASNEEMLGKGNSQQSCRAQFLFTNLVSLNFQLMIFTSLTSV